jgi:hypothetical protein
VYWYFDIHTTELLVPEPSSFEVEISIKKLTSCTSQSADQIPAELIKAAGKTLRSEAHKRIYSIWNMEKLPDL